MDNYFDYLEKNSSAKENGVQQLNDSNGNMVNITVRADAECQVLCDGDFLFILTANDITKEKAPAGQHIFQFISIEQPKAIVEKIVDFPEPGKNYLLLVTELSEQISKIEEETIVTIDWNSKYGNKGKYTGYLKKGKPEGKGKVMYDDGRILESCFRDGSANGHGVMIYPDGGKFEGEYVDGLPNGHCIFKWSNGDIEEGEYVEGSMNGHGKKTFADGRVYEGEYKDGRWNGRGIFKFSNGDIEEGEYVDGSMNGHGKKTFADGRVYEGEYKDGRWNGRGILKFSNGDIFEGNFVNGKAKDGIYKYLNGNVEKGEYVDGKWHASW